MATEKQIDYIKILVNDLKLETMPWVAALSSLPEKWQQYKVKSWLQVALGGSREIREMSYTDIVAKYNARLGELENADWESIDNREASRAIDSLKKCIVVW